jgi:hypothetical protein
MSKSLEELLKEEKELRSEYYKTKTRYDLRKSRDNPRIPTLVEREELFELENKLNRVEHAISELKKVNSTNLELLKKEEKLLTERFLQSKEDNEPFETQHSLRTRLGSTRDEIDAIERSIAKSCVDMMKKSPIINPNPDKPSVQKYEEHIMNEPVKKSFEVNVDVITPEEEEKECSLCPAHPIDYVTIERLKGVLSVIGIEATDDALDVIIDCVELLVDTEGNPDMSQIIKLKSDINERG